MSNGTDMAFPVPMTESPNNSAQFGLTKREYFAALAMQGHLACSERTLGGFNDMETLSRECVDVADALLAELAK
jgi:hypothetical protein